MTEPVGKYTTRNVLGGLIIASIGAIFLGISAFNLIDWAGTNNDIPIEPCDGCPPLEDRAMNAAIGSGILGAILTSIGLFFFVYGMKQQQTPKPPA